MNTKTTTPDATMTYDQLMELADAATDAIERFRRALTILGKHFKVDEVSDSDLLLRAARGQVAYVAGSVDEWD